MITSDCGLQRSIYLELTLYSQDCSHHRNMTSATSNRFGRTLRYFSGRGCAHVHDMRRMPRHIAGFAIRPFAIAGALLFRGARDVQSETAL